MTSRLSIALACAGACSVPAVAQQPQTPQTLKVAYTDAVYSGNELAQGTECKMVRPQ